MIETIKEYLVKIGFKADTDGADKAQKAMDGIQKNAARLMTALKALAVGGTLQKIVGFFTDMARQDLQFQRLARQMWTTRENAEAINRSLEVMGASLQDLWFSPELAQQFMQLRREALGMQAPEELRGQLKEVRSILFEIQRFRLTLQYLGQWVAFFFLTYMERPLAKLKKTIHDDTDDLQKNIPTAANKIGQALAGTGKLFGVSGACSEKFVTDWIRRGVNYMCMNFDFNYIVSGAKNVMQTSHAVLDQLGRAY